MNTLGKRIKSLRDKKKLHDSKWTQEFVADAIGVARPTYTAYENGTKQPPLETVNKLADLFDVSTDYLMGRNIEANTTNQSDEMSDLLEKIRQKGAELEATALLRTASKMNKEQLKDILKVFEMIEKDED